MEVVAQEGVDAQQMRKAPFTQGVQKLPGAAADVEDAGMALQLQPPQAQQIAAGPPLVQPAAQAADAPRVPTRRGGR